MTTNTTPAQAGQQDEHADHIEEQLDMVVAAQHYEAGRASVAAGSITATGAVPEGWKLVAAAPTAATTVAAPDVDEPLPPPSIHAGVHYAAFLRREAHAHEEPKAGALRNAARMIDVLLAEGRRLHRELAQAPVLTQDDIDYIVPAHPPRAQGEGQPNYKFAFDEWHEKTEWLQNSALPAKYLGWHRADVLRDMIEQNQLDAERYRGLRQLAKEQLLNPSHAASEFAPDMRTHWVLPTLMCSGPVGGYVDFDEAVQIAIDAARARKDGAR